VGQGVGPTDTGGFVEQAVEVLASCGYDPGHYRLDLRKNAPVGGSGPGEARDISAVFSPIDATRRHVLTVSPTDPCVVGWVLGAGGLTSWQRDVLERARSHVRTTRPEWSHPERWDLHVTETRDHVGMRLSPGAREPGGSELRVLLRKRDLSIVASDESDESTE
jgi:hypothetical protein